MRPRAEPAAVSFPRGVPAIDWSAVVRTAAAGQETNVQAFDTSTGEQLWSRYVTKGLEVKVVSPDAHLAVLGTPTGGGYSDGRGNTKLVLLSDQDAEPRMLTLDGNVEPEAFSTDGGSLFVIEYMPPQDPTSYRVRRLDLGTEEVGGVYTVDAELQQRMQGTARVQAASPDGDRLYTLYSLEDDHGGLHSFVHVLDLDEKWAHCVDLPSDFRTMRQKAIAMSVSPDGTRLYLADALTGALADIDTEALRVSRTGEAGLGPWGRDPAHLARGSEGTLYVGSGTRLASFDASTFSPGRSWDMPGTIMGIQAGTDGRRIYVGLRDRIAVIDPATGRSLDPLTLDEIGTIDQLGQSIRALPEERDNITCAC